MAMISEKKSGGESNIFPVFRAECSAPPAHPQARRRTLLQHLAAEAEQRGGAAPGGGSGTGGRVVRRFVSTSLGSVRPARRPRPAGGNSACANACPRSLR